MTKATIYKIECLVNGRVYIGRTQNYPARMHQHLANLYSGRHDAPPLAFDFSRYGRDAFEFVVLRDVVASEADREERLEMKARRDANQVLYNGSGKLPHLPFDPWAWL